MGTIFGLALDLLGSRIIGQTSIILGVIGYMRRLPRQKLLKRQ